MPSITVGFALVVLHAIVWLAQGAIGEILRVSPCDGTLCATPIRDLGAVLDREPSLNPVYFVSWLGSAGLALWNLFIFNYSSLNAQGPLAGAIGAIVRLIGALVAVGFAFTVGAQIFGRR